MAACRTTKASFLLDACGARLKQTFRKEQLAVGAKFQCHLGRHSAKTVQPNTVVIKFEVPLFEEKRRHQGYRT